MPCTLAKREGAPGSFYKDSPLTKVGAYQAFLVGQSAKLAGIRLQHVYVSPSLRCVQTADNFLKGDVTYYIILNVNILKLHSLSYLM